MDNKQITAQAPEQTTTAKQTPNKGIFTPDLSQMITERYREQRNREKAVDAHIEGMTEQDKKNSNLQSEILDCCYKAEEIAKATSFLLTEAPEYQNFDPVPMVDALFDYIVQINELVNRMDF